MLIPQPILPICCFPFGVLTVEFSGGSLLSVEPFAELVVVVATLAAAAAAKDHTSALSYSSL